MVLLVVVSAGCQPTCADGSDPGDDCVCADGTEASNCDPMTAAEAEGPPGTLEDGDQTNGTIAGSGDVHTISVLGVDGKGSLSITVTHKGGDEDIEVAVSGEAFTVAPGATEQLSVGTREGLTHSIQLTSIDEASYAVAIVFEEERYEHERNDRCDSGNVCDSIKPDNDYFGRIANASDVDLYALGGMDDAGSLLITVQNSSAAADGVELEITVSNEKITVEPGEERSLQVGTGVNQSHVIQVRATQGIVPYRLKVAFEDARFEHERNDRCDSGNVCDSIVADTDYFGRVSDAADRDLYAIGGMDGAGSLRVTVEDLRTDLENDAELSVELNGEAFSVPVGEEVALSVGTAVNQGHVVTVTATQGIVEYRLRVTFEEGMYEHEPNHRCDSGNVCESMENGDKYYGRVADGADGDRYHVVADADVESMSFAIEALDEGREDGVLKVTISDAAGDTVIDVSRGSSQTITAMGANVQAALTADAGPVPYSIAVSY